MSENEKFYVIYVENDNLLSNNNELKCKKMNTKDKVINYLISNSGSDGNIKISAIELANMLTCTRQNITKIVKELEVDKIVTRKGKTIIVNKSRLILDDLIVKRNLTYSKREQELLYYMFDKYSKRNENFDYIVIPKHEIKKDTSIQNSKHINDYISKFVNDGLIEKIDGDWKKHKANKYKFIFDIDNINIQQKSNENPINDNNDLLEKYNKLLSMYEQLNKRVEYLEKQHNQQHTDNIDIDYNDDKNDDTFDDDDLLKYLDIETEENNIPIDMTEEEIQEKQQKQEKTYNMIDTIIINKKTLISKIENMNLSLSETDIKVLDKLISKSNALNDCVCIIGVLDTYDKVLYTLPKVNDSVFDCIITYFSTTNDDTIDRLYQCII